MVWCDKRPIYFITTKYISDDNTTVQRYDVKQQMKVSAACPAAVKAHNANISGTKKNDQLTKLCRCRHHYRWQRRLLMKFFLWTAYNAYVMQHCFCPHNPPGKTFNIFAEELCHKLVGTLCHDPIVVSHRVSNASDTRLVSKPSVLIHMPQRAAGHTTDVSSLMNTTRRLKDPILKLHTVTYQNGLPMVYVSCF